MAVLVCCCLAKAQGAAVEAPREFTVATYNVLYRNPNLPKLVATLKEAQADLVALQETNAESEKVLRRELASAYPYMRFRGGRGSDGFGYLSKTPLRNLEFLEPLPGGRGAWIAEVMLGGTNVQVASIHLATPNPRQMSSLAAIMAMFQKVEATHAQEIARIHKKLSRPMPIIVLGDFNSFSFFHAPKFLAESGLVDSFASVTERADQHGTWPFRSGENKWTFRIDFIFHSRELRTLQSRIIPSEASDHYPVVSRLGWTEK